MRDDIDRWFSMFHSAAGAADAAGRQPLGRRAADAGGRPGAHVARGSSCSTSRRSGWPLVIQGLFRQFAELNKEGVTMFVVVEQNANLALGRRPSPYVLEAGQDRAQRLPPTS